MDYDDPFPRPFRSVIVKKVKKAQDSNQQRQSAPWPQNETLSPERATPGDQNASSSHTHGFATIWPNFMSLSPVGSESNQELSDISMIARVGEEDKSPMPIPALGTISHTAGLSSDILPRNESNLGHYQQSSIAPGISTLGASIFTENSTISTQNFEGQAESTNDTSHTCAQISSKEHFGDKKRIFCCTFCSHKFKNKYDWARHEKSLHLDLEAWTCAPQSGIINDPVTGHDICAYCLNPEPTPGHLEVHNHSACVEVMRTFNRKDHLVQHLRLIHHLTTVPSLHSWRGQAPPFVCRCGFCDQRLTSWAERTDHLAGHFRKGTTMRDWQGGHGFTPEIAAQVKNSIPPYLIADQP